MRNVISYPKTYATLIEYSIQGQRAGIGQPVKSYSPAEWEEVSHRPGKRRVYYKGSTMKVRLDSGEELTLTDKEIAYQGHKMKYQWQVTKVMLSGLRIKMYKHPKDSRPWRYKLLGE